MLAVLTASGLLALLPDRPPAGVLERVRELTPSLDPRRMDARELRQLPGVGPALARAIAHSRDRSSARLAWEDVPGIGEIRAREIRAWFAERGVAPDPLALGLAGEARAYADPEDETMRAWTTAGLGLLASCGPGAPDPVETPPSETASPTASASPGTSSSAEAEPAPGVRDLVLELGAGRVHALEAGPRSGPGVLFLHGARYQARTWRELGTLERLAQAGYRALALDWPGFGESPAPASEPVARELLGEILGRAGLTRVVLVAPSMSGGFAFDYLGAGGERVAGFVGIAPVGGESFQPPSPWRVPTLLLWGAADAVIPVERGHELAEHLAGARLEILEGASHACYLDQPARFHALLLEFLATALPPGR